MIAALRHRHRVMILVVAIVGFVGLIAALGARPSRPITSVDEVTDTSSWTEILPSGQLRATRQGDWRRRHVLVARGADLVTPDLLVYWTNAVGASIELPDDAVLLGPVGDPGVHRIDLPAGEDSGGLIFYSLGHGGIVAEIPVVSIMSSNDDSSEQGQ